MTQHVVDHTATSTNRIYPDLDKLRSIKLIELDNEEDCKFNMICYEITIGDTAYLRDCSTEFYFDHRSNELITK